MRAMVVQVNVLHLCMNLNICSTISCHAFGGKCCSRMSLVIPTRLRKISGFNDRANDVIHTGPASLPASSVVVFFPGDIQNYLEVMETEVENVQLSRWNLESLAESLRIRFQNSHIAVIKPARMEMKVFSCYDNFVPSDNFGVPSHVPMHHALDHLESVLRNVSTEIGDENKELSSLNLILVGFSKGCVVLNQFLHEIHYFDTSYELPVGVISRITDMYWLDGGHAGSKDLWVTSKRILKSFAKLGITVHIHMTPYQLDNERRPCKKEEKIFSDYLGKIAVSVNRFVHFENQSPSLHNHFEVLNAFR